MMIKAKIFKKKMKNNKILFKKKNDWHKTITQPKTIKTNKTYCNCGIYL